MSNWTLISGRGGIGKSNYASTMDTSSVVKLDWLLVEAIGRHSMYKGEPIVQDFIDTVKQGKKIFELVEWIDTPEKADVMAKHIIQHLPIETDLIIEGYLLSNERFLKSFLRHAVDLDVRVWHTQQAADDIDIY